jgi:Cu(I)/Ag(I) efflux system membrane fusion protein
MSIIQQIQNFSGNTPLNRRRALVGLSLLALTACSRAAKSGAAASSNVAYYTCTMHPCVRSQDPNGKCPICGMNLVPVYTNSATTNANTNPATNAVPVAATSTIDNNGMVNIAPERMQEIGVTTELVGKRELTRPLRAPARIVIDEASLYDVNVKAASGYITQLYADYTGEVVRKGEPLATILSEGWMEAQEDYMEAYRSYKRTLLSSPNDNPFYLKQQIERYRARLRVWDLSDDQIQQLEELSLHVTDVDLSRHVATGLRGTFDLLSPIDGVVVDKQAVQGMQYQSGQSLFRLAKLSPIWVVAEFPEGQAQFVDIGQKMAVSFPSLPQRKVTAEVAFIDSNIDEAQRRLRVRFVVPNDDNALRPGLFAEVSGEVPMGESLTVSTGAVVPTGSKYIVFVDHGGGKLEPREIEVGIHSGDYYEVVSGLNEGDRIVSSANFLIDAESRIQGVLKTWGDQP